MKTEATFQKMLEKLNLQRFVQHSEKIQSPLHRAVLVPTTTYEGYIHKEVSFFHTCLCSSTDFIKDGQNKSHNQRFKCITCGSSRVLSIHVFNLDLAFDTLYEKRFLELCMQRTKQQKIDAFKNDKKTITFFHACIQQLSKDLLETEEILELAFYMTCQQIEDDSWKLVKETTDDWYFLQNCMMVMCSMP